MRQKKALSLLMVFVMIFGTMGGSFATYYDQLPTATNVKVSNISYEYKTAINPYTYRYFLRNTIRFTVNWSNVESYSFNNENWYSNYYTPKRTFYIREDYHDSTPVSGVEVVLPKSVNTMFLYVKESSGSSVKVYQYKLSNGDLSFIYGENPVPEHIIRVTDRIDLLPTKDNLTLSSETKVKEARAAFDTLGVDKIWVYNAHKLYDLETRLDELKTKLIDWTKIYKDLDNANSGKLTEQYYEVPNKLYADLYDPADKNRIFQNKIGTAPKYTTAGISTNVIKDTTPQTSNVFFTYRFNETYNRVMSPAMAKKVWGFFTPLASGSYEFKITSDDGHNWVMYLDNGEKLANSEFNMLKATTTIANQFDLHDIRDFTTGKFALKANTPYPLFIEYFNHGGNAALKLQYRIVRDTESVGNWTEMKGDVFKPSTAYEFGFLAGNATELQKRIIEAQDLKALYDTLSKIGTLEGQVSQAALNELLSKLNGALLTLEDAKKNILTQVQINEATNTLSLAIEAFKNAVVKKPNGVSSAFSAQNGTDLLVEFNKDQSVTTYEIIISADNTLSPDDKVYQLTNQLYNLNLLNTLPILETNLGVQLKGSLNKKALTNGRYSFNIPLGSLIDSSAVTVFIRTATGDNKGDAIANSIGLLKKPSVFRYAVADDNVIFYTVDKVADSGFAIDYFANKSTVATRVYLTRKDSDYYVLPKDSVDLNKISNAMLYRIKVENGTEASQNGISDGTTNPAKIEIGSVEDLKLAIANENYTLNWMPYQGSNQYEIYSGNTNLTSDMTKLSNTTATNSFDLGKYSTQEVRYYAVKAIVNNDQYTTRSGFSNVVKVIKPSAPAVLKLNDKPRTLQSPDVTNYIIKSDKETSGYYIVTMPAAYLNLVDVKAVVEDKTGNYIVNFPEVNKDENRKYKELADITSVTQPQGADQSLVSVKVPYALEDVGISIQGVKHTVLKDFPAQISVVKYVEEGTATKVISGISAPTNIDLTIKPSKADVTTNASVISGGVTQINNGILTTMMGSEFEIVYNYVINADKVFKPNFTFDFKENDYFGFDYPTVKSIVTDQNTPVKFNTAVSKDANGKMTVTVRSDELGNFANQVLTLTLKVKPLAKKNDLLMKLAVENGLLNANEEWKLSYVIEDIHQKGDSAANVISVMQGLTIDNSIDFNTSDNPTAADINRITNEDPLKIQFKNKEKINSSY